MDTTCVLVILSSFPTTDVTDDLDQRKWLESISEDDRALLFAELAGELQRQIAEAIKIKQQSLNERLQRVKKQGREVLDNQVSGPSPDERATVATSDITFDTDAGGSPRYVKLFCANCGRSIYWRRFSGLCADCEKLYPDPKMYPPWLEWTIWDNRRQWKLDMLIGREEMDGLET